VVTAPVEPLVDIAFGFRFPVLECIGLNRGVERSVVGNLDRIAIASGFADVTASMFGRKVVTGGAGIAPTFVGGFIMTGVGFIMTGVGFIMTGVGFIMTGAGFIMTGAGFIMPGIGFIMGTMPGIPDPIDSRFFVSSISTEIDLFR
jgi:hypothetical protein